jgi:hypothetical protein
MLIWILNHQTTGEAWECEVINEGQTAVHITTVTFTSWKKLNP